MKYKVSELEGALLDAAVGAAHGWTHEQFNAWASAGGRTPRSFLKWYWGGPIIERERISIFRIHHEYSTETEWWTAGFNPSVSSGEQCDSGWMELPAIELECEQIGATALIAAMRAYCASRFGDEVELLSAP